MHRMAVLTAIAAATLVTSGCSAITDQLDGEEVGSRETTEVAAVPLLTTRQWGVVDGLLSVVVENTTDRTLRYATGYVTARTDDNEIVAASIESDATCCEVVDLAPGGEYGFYLDVGEDAGSITRVDVGYRNFSWAPAAEEPAPATVRAKPVRIDQGPSSAVVTADLVSAGAHDEVVAQAFVTDRAGDFIAVVSGRWSCLVDGRRSIRMELFHLLPEGAKVERVLVHPVSDDPTRAKPDCSSGAAL